MKKAAKAVTTATSLLALITGNAIAKDMAQFDNVRESVQSVQALVLKKDSSSVAELFDKVETLSQKILQVNANLIQNKFKISRESFVMLQTIRDLLELNSTILVNNLEEQIIRQFRTQYRAYTHSIGELDYSIARIKEKLNLTKIINHGELQISADELAQINQAAKALSTL